MIRLVVISLVALAASVFGAQAQEAETPLKWNTSDGFIYEVNAGVNIGGSAPIPIPAQIRKIEGYNPNLNLSLGGRVSRWLDAEHRWGVAVGLRFESKGMKTDASVKNYGMEIIQDGATVSGRWTGKVHTNYHSSQLTIPVTALWRIDDRWMLNAGPYVAFALNSDFNGHVYDGYLREGDPTGEKAVFEGSARATYDFSSSLRRLQWGMQIGGSWLAMRHLAVNANFTWGLNGIFKSSFKTVTFSLYPIYLNLGFSYIF